MTHGRAVRQFRVGCSVKTIGAMRRWCMGADMEKGRKTPHGTLVSTPRMHRRVPSTPVAAIDIQTAAALSATGAITRHDTSTGDAVWLVMAAALAQSLWEWDERPSAAQRAKVGDQN